MSDDKSAAISDSGGDLYRDTPIRLLGYANEVGEAFRSLIRLSAVRFSYVIASGYVVADTLDKSLQFRAKEEDGSSRINMKMVHAAVDTLIWQSFASVIIPGFTINRLCFLAGLLLRKTGPQVLSRTAQKWTVTAFGLSCIPFIVKPIDRGVDFAMDRFVRPVYLPPPYPEEIVEHSRPVFD